MNQRAAPDADDVRVLFVEDDVSVAQMYRLKLELDGYTVEVAGDGLVALEKAKTMHPDIIFLPDEPYEFTSADAVEVRGPRVIGPFPGHLFTWHGTRTILGLRFLREQFGSAR